MGHFTGGSCPGYRHTKAKASLRYSVSDNYLPTAVGGQNPPSRSSSFHPPTSRASQDTSSLHCSSIPPPANPQELTDRKALPRTLAQAEHALEQDNPREGGGYSPQVEEHVGLLVQNHLDVAGVDQGVIHLVPLSIASLSSSGRGGYRKQQSTDGPQAHFSSSVRQSLTVFAVELKLSTFQNTGITKAWSTIPTKIHIYLFIYLGEGVCTCHTSVEVRGQLEGGQSVLPLWGFLGWNSGGEAWR